MAGTVWSKWFWSDWNNDPTLKMCSYGAQGLWMRMLCIMVEADPHGYLVINGKPLDPQQLARLTGGTLEEVETHLAELQSNGVFSVDRAHRIFSRRLVREAKRGDIARKNGLKGGNPSLGKDKEKNDQLNPPANPPVVKTQNPESNSQSPEEEEDSLPQQQQGSHARAHEAASWDAVELADHLCRIGGVRHVDPNRIGDHIALVREWMEAGADPPFLATVIQKGRDSARNGINSLKYFDTRVRNALARRDHPNVSPDHDDLSTIRDPLLRRYLENGGALRH